MRTQPPPAPPSFLSRRNTVPQWALTRLHYALDALPALIARLDINLFTIGRNLDNGYRSFMGMAAMVEVCGWRMLAPLLTLMGAASILTSHGDNPFDAP